MFSQICQIRRSLRPLMGVVGRRNYRSKYKGKVLISGLRKSVNRELEYSVWGRYRESYDMTLIRKRKGSEYLRFF